MWARKHAEHKVDAFPFFLFGFLLWSEVHNSHLEAYLVHKLSRPVSVGSKPWLCLSNNNKNIDNDSNNSNGSHYFLEDLDGLTTVYKYAF